MCAVAGSSIRIAQPDEVWNFQRGDGLEKAITLAYLGSFLVDPSCQAGTPFDARLSADAPRMLSRPVH